jgi:hypothetical protein
MSIYLVPYEGSVFTPGDIRYVFEPSNGTFDTERVNHDKGLAGASGWGWTPAILSPKVSTPFIAIYVLGKTVRLWLPNREITLSPLLSASVEILPPLHKKFTLSEAGCDVCEYLYAFTGFEDSDNDLFEYAARAVNSSDQRKLFAYIFSAHAAGKSRKLPEYGFADEVIGRISDPFDTDHDV